MSLFLKILIVVLIVLTIVLVVLYFLGKRMEKKSAEQKEAMDAAAQNITMLVIDKKRMKLKEANLPKIVLEQTPRYLRGSRLPIVKAKVGPKIMNLVCDEKIFDLIPVKTEVKAVVSGIYITSIKNIRGSVQTPAKKKGFFGKIKDKFKK